MLNHAPVEFNARERELLDALRTFRAEMVEPAAQQREDTGRIPPEVLHEASRTGLLAMEVPSSLGGGGHRFRLKIAACEALARSDMGLAFALINSQNVAARLAGTGIPQHRDHHVPALISGEILGATALTEPTAGSDFTAIRTRAEKADGGWILNGEKAWITNAARAELFLTYAQTDPSAGHRGIACFLVDARRQGFSRGETPALLGGNTIGAGGFTLTDCFVPDEDVISPPGAGFRHAMTGVNGARVYVSAMCAGIIATSLRTALEYGARRRAFGRPLIEHQGLRWSLTDVANDLEALRGLTWTAAVAIERDEPAILPAAHAKKFAGRVTVPAVTACIQAMGAQGLRTECSLGRHLGCAKVAAYTDGSTEMMNERIGAELSRRYGAPNPDV